MPSFHLIFNLDKNLFIIHSCWSWCMSQLSSCCFSSQMSNSYMLRGWEFMNTLILKKSHYRGLAWTPRNLYWFSHCWLENMGNSLAARAWYPPCHPFVFLFWGCPGPQSWMTHPFHCAGNTKGREELVHWDQLTANWPVPYCSLWLLSRSRIMARWHAELLPGSC